MNINIWEIEAADNLLLVQIIRKAFEEYDAPKQGIHLCEFRYSGGRRKIVATVYS